MSPRLLWYAAYGSNMCGERFRRYLEGGSLGAGGREHHGARDPSRPLASAPLWLPGTGYFATVSWRWGGGCALYDPLTPGHTAARAWLITPGQLSDVAAQEMRLAPGSDLELPLVPGATLAAGPGKYQVLACEAVLAGYPVITLAAPWRAGSVPALAPAPAYAAIIREGLREAHGWDAARSTEYLAAMQEAGQQEEKKEMIT